MIFGSRPRAFFRPEIFKPVWQFGEIHVLGLSVYTIFITAVLLVFVYIIIYRTRIGMAMRAVSRDMQAVPLMGIDVNRVIAFTFGMGSALAAAGGILWAMKYPQIEPLMGIFPGLKAFVALGAYTAALLTLTAAEKEMSFIIDPCIWPLSVISIPFLPAVIMGGLVAAFFGFLMGFPVFRVRGDYLAIVTLGFGEVIRVVANNLQSVTNGPLGLKGIAPYTNLW